MTPRAAWIAAAALLVLMISAGCRKSAQEQAAEKAEVAATGAVSQSQRQLWQDVADKGAAPGLERVPTAERPVEQRNRATTGTQSSIVTPQPITIPKGIQNTIRIQTYPINPAEIHDGPATVADTSGDRIVVELGAKRSLSVLARVMGRPVPVAAGEAVRVAYQSRRDLKGQRSVIGIQNAAGAGIAHVMESSDNPIDTVVPLFTVNVRQLGSEPSSPVRITVGGGGSPRDLQPGESAQVGDVTVFIIGSAGPPPGGDVGQIEGKPYALNVMVWKVP